MHCHQLAAFLTEMTEYADPLDYFYRGAMAEAIAKELKETGNTKFLAYWWVCDRNR